MKNRKRPRNLFLSDIQLHDGKTNAAEIIRETLINFLWGFFGNSITLFISKEIDAAIFINFILYYLTISYIVNRAQYKTKLGKFIILPGSAALGAFSGYKFAQFISGLF